MVVLLVRVEGLEPSRREAPDPKSGASAIPPHSQVPFYSTMLPAYWSNKKYGIIFLYIYHKGGLLCYYKGNRNSKGLYSDLSAMASS